MSHNLVDIDVDSYLSRHNKSRTRGNHNIERRKTRTFYFPRTVREWNALPTAIVEPDSLARFQSGLSDYLGSD